MVEWQLAEKVRETCKQAFVNKLKAFVSVKKFGNSAIITYNTYIITSKRD